MGVTERDGEREKCVCMRKLMRRRERVRGGGAGSLAMSNRSRPRCQQYGDGACVFLGRESDGIEVAALLVFVYCHELRYYKTQIIVLEFFTLHWIEDIFN